MSLRGILLDLGHTLLDYAVDDGALLTSYSEVHDYLERLNLGPQPVQPDLMLRVSQRALDAVVASYERGEIEELDMITLFDEALRHHGWQLRPELVRELVWREHTAFARHLFVPEETVAALGEIRRRGFRVGLVSNATVPGPLMRNDLELLGLAPLIDAAVFSSEIGVRKPDPRIFQAVLEPLELDPRECLFVGDRLKEDIGGARSLGMRAVLTHEYRQEEPPATDDLPIIRRFPELLQLLD